MAQFIPRSKVRTFESALEKLGRILAEKWKIKVIFKHDTCMTDGRTIYLPVIPNNASDEYLGAIQGFLDHEVGHIRFSDFKTLKSLKARDRKLWNFTQALEDIRIENEMRKLWRGAGVNFNRCNSWALKQIKEKWEDISPFGRLCQGILCIGHETDTDSWFVDELLKKDQELWDKLEKVKDLAIGVKKLSSSDEVVEQAKEIMIRLNEEEEPEQPEQEGEEGEEGSQMQGAPIPGEPGEGTGEASEMEPGPGGKQGKNVLQTDPEKVKQDEELTSRHNMIRDGAKQELADVDRYLIYTTEGDVLEKIDDGDKVETQKFLQETRAMVNVLRKKMRLNLLSIVKRSWAYDKRRGHINQKAIFRVPIGTSKRVFKKQVTSPGFNTRASLWIDHSGSMRGEKVNLAAKAALLFGEVLDELDIPFEICGHSTTDFDTGEKRYDRAPYAEQEVFTRWGDMWVGVYKGFEDEWRRVRHRCINMARNTRANTFDGEAVRLAASRLIQYPEDRKILFVFNDGCPCPNVYQYASEHRRYCKEMAKEVESVVELFAIGINSHNVKDYYSNSVSIESLEDLPKVMLQKLDTLLRKGKPRRAA